MLAASKNEFKYWLLLAVTMFHVFELARVGIKSKIRVGNSKPMTTKFDVTFLK